MMEIPERSFHDRFGEEITVGCWCMFPYKKQIQFGKVIDKSIFGRIHFRLLKTQNDNFGNLQVSFMPDQIDQVVVIKDDLLSKLALAKLQND